jgi:hypothetical protein
VGLAILLFLVGFGMYVRSVPAKEPKMNIQKVDVPPGGAANQNIKLAVEEDGTVPKIMVDEAKDEKDEGETLEL